MKASSQCSIPLVKINSHNREFIINQDIILKSELTKRQIQVIIKKNILPESYQYSSQQKDKNIRLTLICLQKDNNEAVRFNNYETYSGNIIKQIIHVQFFKTVSINLNSNLICNIQDLQFLVAQNIVVLQLYNNHITKIGALFKNNLIKTIRTLTIYRNKIKQINTISRAMFPILKCMEIQANQHQDLLMQDLLFAMKLQSKAKQPLQQKQLKCASNQRIKQPQFKILKKNKFKLY